MPYSLRSEMRIAVLGVTLMLAIVHFIVALNLWNAGDPALIQSYVFCILLPAAIIILFSLMEGTRTKEGLLMRFGTMLQLVLIIAIPPLSLYLALGLPVVFLVVEMFVSRVPAVLSQPIEKLIIG